MYMYSVALSQNLRPTDKSSSHYSLLSSLLALAVDFDLMLVNFHDHTSVPPPPSHLCCLQIEREIVGICKSAEA